MLLMVLISDCLHILVCKWFKFKWSHDVKWFSLMVFFGVNGPHEQISQQQEINQQVTTTQKLQPGLRQLHMCCDWDGARCKWGPDSNPKTVI